MNKIVRKAFLLLTLIPLSSCADVAELYPGDAYVGGDFLHNHYSHYDNGIKEAVVEKTIELVNDKSASSRYFCGSGEFNALNKFQGFDQAKEWHPESFGNLVWSPDIYNPGIGVWADQSSMVGKAYGATKKMSLINEKFSRGYLSKLYNGQVRCNAWSSYSLVELDETGYGTIFPAELSSAPYFAMAVRGGSDYGPWRIATFDINVTFYKEDLNRKLVGTKFTLNGVKLQANYSSEMTSLVGFYFNEIGETYDPKGIVGMSMDFSLVEESYDLYSAQAKEALGDIPSCSTNFKDGSEYHIGLILLEVLFPDSTWF